MKEFESVPKTMPSVEGLLRYYDAHDNEGIHALGEWQLHNDDSPTSDADALERVFETTKPKSLERTRRLAQKHIKESKEE